MITKGNKDLINTEQRKKGTNYYFHLQIKQITLAEAISNKQKMPNQLTYSTP